MSSLYPTRFPAFAYSAHPHGDFGLSIGANA